MIFIIPLLIGMVVYVAVEARRSGGIGVEPELVGTPGTRGSSPKAVIQLARAEMRRLRRSPVFISGILMFSFAGFAIGFRQISLLHETDSDLALFFFPLAWMTLLATNLAVLRGRRDSVEELFGTMPVSRDARTLAHIASIAAAFFAAVTLLAFTLAFMVWQGFSGTPDLGELLTGPLLVFCAGIVGVATARIIPSSIGGLMALVLMGVLQGLIDHYSHEAEHVSHWFAFWVSEPEEWPGDLLSRRPWSHLLYLSGLGMFAAVCGFLRHRRDRTVLIALGVSLMVAATGGFVQSRPRTDAEWDRIASWMAEPAKHQTCVIDEQVRYCSYDNYEGVRAEWIRVVSGVRALVPPQARDRLTEVRQRIPASTLWLVPRQIKARIGSLAVRGNLWPQDGTLHPSDSWWCVSSHCGLDLSIHAATLLVGLPTQGRPAPPGNTGPDGDPQPILKVDASGSARSVIALWLGAAASDSTRKQMLGLAGRTIPADAEEAWRGDPLGPTSIEGCGGVADTGTLYGRNDIGLAVSMLRLPRDEVARTISREWDQLTTPDATAMDVADLLDLQIPEPRAGYFAFC